MVGSVGSVGVVRWLLWSGWSGCSKWPGWLGSGHGQCLAVCCRSDMPFTQQLSCISFIASEYRSLEGVIYD